MSDSLSSPEYIGWRLEVFVGVFTPVQIVLVALRCYARSITARSVRQSAVGHHIGYLEETNPEAVTLFFKYLVAVSAWYYVTIWISKVAICLLYRRLFPQKTVHVIVTITLGILISTSIACLIADLAACKPFSANWAPPAVQAVQCIDKETLFIWSTLPNIVTDVIMLVLPLPIVWRLHTSTQMKGALTITFLIGSMGLVASACRFWAFSNTNSFTDATYNAVELIIWTVVEPGIYLLSASMLMFRPLFERFNIHSLKIGSRDRSKNYRHSDVLRAPYDSERGGIALGSRPTNGFEHIADDEDPQDATKFASAQHASDRPATSNIKITTNIKQSWKNV
ncbi:hypothetical protein E8E14_006260 [Neopestalotiopsis sp. 37M]|nr:hypothetical protein E8E14_006260 [Neopestalotiopsis sp. 37M]